MKQYSFIAILIAAVFVGSCSSSKQATSEKDAATAQQVNEKIQAKDYQIDVDYATPARGKGISLSYGYNLKIRNDSAIVYLPYYGVAYSAPYGGGEGGIKFGEPMKEYKAVPQKKAGDWKITFKADTPDYNYDVTIDVYSNGRAYLTFNSFQRQSINFNGQVKL